MMKSEQQFIPMWPIVALLLILGVGGFVLPFAVAKSPSLNNYFPPGNLPNYINGISTPVLYLLTSILLFLSFREQRDANKLLRIQINQTLEEVERKNIFEQILQYELLIDKIGAASGASGNNILQSLFCNYINRVNHHGESGEYKADPNKHIIRKHTNLYFAITEFERLFTTISTLENQHLSETVNQKLRLIFQYYFSGVLTIQFSRSKFTKPGQEDYIQMLLEKVKAWNSTLL